MARPPYRTARQEHLADALIDLAERGRLTWRYDYDNDHSRALFYVTEPNQPERMLLVRPAEQVAVRHYQELKVAWLPVPPNGGERERAETLRRMQAL